MTFFRKKRIFALLLICFLLLLFYNTSWLGKIMYPLKYREDIQISATNYDVDPYLMVAIIRVESNFNTNLQSKKGAIGLMQLMPETAQWIIDTAGYSPSAVEQLTRADVNIEIGAWYLNKLYKQFKGKPYAIMAAYNAGPGKVQQWLDNDVWDGRLETVEQIPYGETRHYIQRVLYYYKKYKKIYAPEWPETG